MAVASPFTKYVNKATREEVTAMYYTDIRDFKALYQLIGHVYPTLSPAHTRIWENHWVVLGSNNKVEFICCEHGERCFETKYEKYK